MEEITCLSVYTCRESSIVCSNSNMYDMRFTLNTDKERVIEGPSRQSWGNIRVCLVELSNFFSFLITTFYLYKHNMELKYITNNLLSRSDYEEGWDI